MAPLKGECDASVNRARRLRLRLHMLDVYLAFAAQLHLETAFHIE